MDVVQIGHLPVRPVWLWLKPRGLDRIMPYLNPRAAKKFFAFAAANLRRGAAEEVELKSGGGAAERQDIFHYVYRAIDPETGGAGFSLTELQGESQLLIVAGLDTSGTALAATMFYLVRHPAAYARLAAEVRAAFPAGAASVAAGPALQGCCCLRACLDEAMRLNPPASGDLPREVLPGGLALRADDGGTSLVRAGTTVGVAAHALHHRPGAFPDPFAFRPERWLAGPGAAPGRHRGQRRARRGRLRVLLARPAPLARAAVGVRGDERRAGQAAAARRRCAWSRATRRAPAAGRAWAGAARRRAATSCGTTL